MDPQFTFRQHRTKVEDDENNCHPSALYFVIPAQAGIHALALALT